MSANQHSSCPPSSPLPPPSPAHPQHSSCPPPSPPPPAHPQRERALKLLSSLGVPNPAVTLLQPVLHAPGFEKYVGMQAGELAHEAGYDAFMTGSVFLRLLPLIEVGGEGFLVHGFRGPTATVPMPAVIQDLGFQGPYQA